ncbi:hypothetical protein [Galbibacter pacificus]|uniref:DUF4252 domain-containing protein n=1 Tax=Galbibacter pacificus TaxID=2996052 RepID=A0ABT6FV01_9FLAO|nr:hypothetical protein [Galbibacter pacificus]MDG3583441.1 hypothetical protein [Galbibacter pacificus]MDG3587082.1 hypothetical protein [Galbibacter pacificus]
MKKHIFLIVLMMSALGFGQKTIYQSESFKELSKDHKTVAIVPFEARLELDNKNLTAEQLKKLQEKEGYEAQNALESYFLKRHKRKDYRIEFQDIKNTNALLAKEGIDLLNLDIYTTQDLCKILGVDALISGDLTLNALISEGVSTDFDFMSFISGTSDYGRIAIKLSDGATGKLLWKYEKVITRKSGKNTYDIIEAMMRKSTRKFPYDK